MSADTTVFEPEAVFEVPEPRQRGRQGRQKTRPRPDRKPEQVGAVIAGLDGGQFHTVTFRDGPDGASMTRLFRSLSWLALSRLALRKSPG